MRGCAGWSALRRQWGEKCALSYGIRQEAAEFGVSGGTASQGKAPAGFSRALPACACSRVRSAELPHRRGLPAQPTPPSEHPAAGPAPRQDGGPCLRQCVTTQPCRTRKRGDPMPGRALPAGAPKPPALRDPMASGSPATPGPRRLPGGARLSSRGRSQPAGPRGSWCVPAPQPPGGPPAFWRGRGARQEVGGRVPAPHPLRNECEGRLSSQPVSAPQCSRTHPAECPAVWGPRRGGGLSDRPRTVSVETWGLLSASASTGRVGTHLKMSNQTRPLG